MKNLLVLLMAMMFLSSCASTTTKTTQGSGFLGDYYQNLAPGTEKGDPKLMWIKPGVDFSKYDKIMFEYVLFALSEESETKAFDANEMKELADTATKTFVDTIGKDFPLVNQPAPDVLRVRVAITDLK
jgi:uncharacterized protein YceK